MDIKKFYNNLYDKVKKKITLNHKSNPTGTWKNPLVSQYIFDSAYLRMYYSKKDGMLEMNITVERFGPNQTDIRLFFTEEELTNSQTIDLFAAILLLINRCEMCPEYYNTSSEFLKIAFNKSEFGNLIKVCNYDGYSRFYQRLLWEIVNIKENAQGWIDFVNSKYFKAFCELQKDDSDLAKNKKILSKYKIEPNIKKTYLEEVYDFYYCDNDCDNEI